MKKRLAFSILLLLLFNVSIIQAQEDNTMYAHYIDVGQGAAVLLEFPCGAVLIDAGAQDENYHRKLIKFLTAFFVRRTDLHNTIALVMVTHPHIDHNEALVEVAQRFRVERYIDDGLQTGSGRANQKWMQGQTVTAAIKYETYSYEDITKGKNDRGLTSAVIDPVNCTNGDPKITLYSGNFNKQPEDWSDTDFKNYNNHSLVIKVLFGKASFLFTGDLEKKGIQKLIDTYGKTSNLDVDVLMVGHHGAANATTDEYLKLVSPKYAIISCGEWNYGKGGTDKFTTWYYGHPRLSTIQMLENVISAERPSVHVKAADGARDFHFINEKKQIYATGWDETITVRATTAGQYKVTTEKGSD